MKGTCVKIVLALALLVGFTCGTVSAQTFTDWDGTLWKIKQSAKGVLFTDPTANVPPDGKARGTEQVWAVMSSNAAGDVMSLSIYGKDPDTDECELPVEIPLTLQYGGPLGFVATIEADVPIFIRGLFYFTGKWKDSTIQNGKLTTLGGYSIQGDWDDSDSTDDIATFGFTMSGTMLKEPKGCLPQ